MLIVSLVIARVLAEAGGPAPDLTDDDSVLLIQRRDALVGDGCDSPPDEGEPPEGECTMLPGDAVTMVVQPKFTTDPQGARFAVLFVTPARPIVETRSSYLFEDLARVTAPRVQVQHVYVQDPALGKQCGSSGCAAPQESSGCEAPPRWEPPPLGDGGPGDGGLVVETIGPYEVLRTEPADTDELATWLADLGYHHDQADLEAAAPYIALGYAVVAVRVAVEEPAATALVPLALTWSGSELRLPVAFGTARSDVASVVYIAGEGRFELPGAYVSFAQRTSFGDAGFLTRNVLVLDSESPADDPVAVRAPTDLLEHEVVVHEEVVRIPLDDCGDLDLGCCGACSTQRHRVRPDLIAILLACGYIVRRRRRR